MAAAWRDRKKRMKKPTKIQERRPNPDAEPRFGVIRSRFRAYPRSLDQLEYWYCYICGMQGHLEHFCPYNYIFGQFVSGSCGGECPPGPGRHRITSRAHLKFLRCLVRVSNLPPGFMDRDLQEFFRPFGPLLLWDVPRFMNGICGCSSQILMRFRRCGVREASRWGEGDRRAQWT
ncbi:hypothetical protein C2845_PM04G22000 [Panicum miliaceum]|uniref:CCHC-type domain-containing protein n=1 Tax=Panicum miliaceum TaxID=4540 RepID=A0A3L6QSV2_PANMI|nr:hypothetical protein C2845_PM04G22000 [Panicum miliaceum]